MRIVIIFTLLLFISDLNAKVVYVDPVKGAKFVSISNNIIIGFDEIIEESELSNIIKVTGSRSGIHQGETVLTSDRMKIIFIPNHPFFFNETVEVKMIRLKTSGTPAYNLKYTFRTQLRILNSNSRQSFISETGNSFYEGKTVISDTLKPPVLTVKISNNPSPGNLYLSNFPFTLIPNTPHLLIADNSGTYSYLKRLTYFWALDFKKQPNGMLSYGTNDKFYTQDPQHNVIDSFECGNGYTTDHHEFILTENGHSFLMSYDPQPIDMSVVVPGGNPNATVIGLVIQELDENKNVVFQWRSWDHIAITDAVHEDLTAVTVDCVHGNAIELDNDGNLMISSRHLSEITKISRTTGNIIWRLGGIHNQFTFINDPLGFSYQHHIRRIANGNITLFDNGNYHPTPFSRAVEYSLDEINKTATLVWQYRNFPDIYGFAMGSAQRLKNGNTLISWGSANPTMTEVTPSGEKVLEMSLPLNIYTYRTFKDESYLTVNLKLSIEGFYNTHTKKLNLKDTVRAYIRKILPPYDIIDSSKSIIDSVSLTGNFRFNNVMSGMHYISTKHRNGLETWSKAGGESLMSDGIYNYDFTNNVSSAFGDNLVLKGSKYCIYSGDVNQDGNIDLSDLILISNDVAEFTSGYTITDVDGNNVTDLTDNLITYNNSSIFINVISP